MKAGTAQKIVLNLFSTTVMVKMGRVYRGLMVDMRARNAKLSRRAEAIVSERLLARTNLFAALGKPSVSTISPGFSFLHSSIAEPLGRKSRGAYACRRRQGSRSGTPALQEIVRGFSSRVQEAR
jgi:hypothetical protein